MPSIRIGYSTDFNLNNELVGIGVTTATSTLDVAGQIVADNTAAASGGVSTFREYQGFQQIQQDISNNILIDNGSNGNFNSLSGEIRISGETTVSSSSTITGGKLETLTVTDKFAVPLGDTNSRDGTPEAGTTRFNQDFGTLEFFDGVNWKTVNSYARGGAAGRAVFGKGGNPNTLQPYQYLNINTRGRSEYFGESTNSNYISCNACGDGIRGLWGGNISANQDVIEYITMASAGDAIDFGNLTQGRDSGSSTSSSTRGLWSAGISRVPSTSGSNVIDYVEIQTLGNALDFGDLFFTSTSGNGVVSSGIRGFFQSGGYPATNNGINMVTIASKGDAIDFGDLSYYAAYKGGFSSSVRAVIGGGMAVYPATPTDQQDTYIMASAGTVTNFGNLTVARHSPGGASTHVRGIYAGGSAPNDGTALAVVDSVIIASDGTAEDYAELSTPLTFGGGVSDSHGGLGGF
jgi:hypothetical protein